MRLGLCAADGLALGNAHAVGELHHQAFPSHQKRTQLLLLCARVISSAGMTEICLCIVPGGAVGGRWQDAARLPQRRLGPEGGQGWNHGVGRLLGPAGRSLITNSRLNTWPAGYGATRWIGRLCIKA